MSRSGPAWRLRPSLLALLVALSVSAQAQSAQPPLPAPGGEGAAVTAPDPARGEAPEAPAEGPAAASAGAAPTEDPAEASRRRQREALEQFSEEDSARLTKEEPGMGWVMFQTFLALGIVLLLVYLTLNYGVRRMMGLRLPTGLAGLRLVDVVERVPLDQKRAMYVVKVAGEYLLIGGTDGGLNLLSKIDGEEVARLQREKAAQPPPALSPFLQKLLSRRDGTPPKTG